MPPRARRLTRPRMSRLCHNLAALSPAARPSRRAKRRVRPPPGWSPRDQACGKAANRGPGFAAMKN
eukprot:4010447-Lingulodinium_polyedra.AAC.1